MSQAYSSRHRKRESQFARNLAAIKTEFQLLLGTIDPLSAFNYLHHEGIVSSSEKKEFDKHLSSNEAARRTTVSCASLEESKKHTKNDPKEKQQQQAAREKLVKIVESKDDHNELKSIVIALNAFKKLHQSVLIRRQTVEPQAMDPLLAGSSSNQEEVTQRQGSLPENELLAAFEQGTHSPEELTQLLEKNRDQCMISEVTNFEGKTLLHLACCMQPVEVVKALVIEHNCDPNVQDNDGNTALHEASRCRKPIVANFIVKLPSCNPNILNSSKETPLHLALRKQHWRLSKVILKSGKVDKAIANWQGHTPMELIEKHPQNHERTRMKKLLDRSTSVMSYFSDDSDTTSPPLSPIESQPKFNMPLSDQTTSISGGTSPAHQATEPKSKGILRPFSLDSIHTSQLEIVVERLDESEGTISTASLDSRKPLLILEDLKETGRQEKLVNNCCTCAEVFSRTMFFLVAFALCLMVLVAICIYLSLS